MENRRGRCGFPRTAHTRRAAGRNRSRCARGPFPAAVPAHGLVPRGGSVAAARHRAARRSAPRSEEHTSELQSPCNLVCRLLLEKKKIIISHTNPTVAVCLFTYSRNQDCCLV